MNDRVNTRKNGRINVVLNHKQTPHTNEADSLFKSEQDRQKHEILDRFEKELEEYVGLNEVKRLIKEIYAWLYINQKRKELGLRASKQVLHMIFKGNPGTGKTTVARMIASFFHEMNVLAKGQLIEVERADLVGEYIGHTAQKTREVIKKANGGVLFIDEAYSLSRGGEKDFGKEAIDTLVKAMEDQQHEFVLILAGYQREMEYFLSLNPGLPSRFPIAIDFPNYTSEELLEMAARMVIEREYELTDEAKRHVKEHLRKLRLEQEKTFSNGRYIRNIIEEAIRMQAVRLLKEGLYDRESLVTLEKEDFNFDASHVKLK
ncbi:stage V sporulation protein K [Alkalihalophilus marmarensis]|jgi:stage V sporulation protein K|uniref:Stage V sporulation protein K n=1 Tax=Alkalihalophilus marmarensis DSM 21297 TaxID=1188261 RepID=U6SR29_9BACI|nr:stage V sporulation protein K [Alkalihalophilus marmarensis]ERN53335.1 stage V sporulation protein K [Alkalihalophilus marmarensis DSM 21297]MCM3489491.1 stage V sporulation protein K [Alkalihalophilus marmarensis]